jgi:maltose alpha-D-glucosyltransferase/alpha-amylase
MGDDLSLKERLSVRTPMQWTSEQNGGFTTAKAAFRPVIDKGDYGYSKINVEQQWRDSSSLFTRIASMIRMRKACPEIGLGVPTFLESGSKDVVAIRYDYEGKSVLVLHNFADETRAANLSLNGSRKLYDLWNRQGDMPISGNRISVDLPAYGYRWFRIDHILP